MRFIGDVNSIDGVEYNDDDSRSPLPLNDYERHGGEKVMFKKERRPLTQRVAKNLILKLKS